ncbi:uncharacterized protein [Cicer arietinum]|uniref:uncharacterized protein n=1 Tax=Cicer arietinum TaxID=3827 RepID=UPI003CC66269
MVLVKEYPHVFSTEIPRLPPVRKVEFFIDLHLGTEPILIALYRMSPLEFNEPNGQIEDFLEKGFTRPSVSPWRALVLNEEEHGEHLRQVLEVLREKQLHVNLSKCQFWQEEVNFLGHVINKEGIDVDPAKIETVIDWKQH